MAPRARLLDRQPTLWICPSCYQQHVTYFTVPHSPMHTCPSLRGVWAPFVPAGVRAALRVEHRGDYIRGDDVRITAEGDPSVMAVIVERDEGEDRFVFAPCAHLNRPRGSTDGMGR
jgi:hypothetical protein